MKLIVKYYLINCLIFFKYLKKHRIYAIRSNQTTGTRQLGDGQLGTGQLGDRQLGDGQLGDNTI